MTESRTTARWYTESWRSASRAILVTIVGGIVVGVLTSYGQTVLPHALRSLANSAGGWSAFCFLIVWLSRARPLLGGALGLVAFELMNEAYTAVTLLRGFPANWVTIWVEVAVVAGPVIGVAASITRFGTPRRRVVAVAVLSVVFVGEGAFGLIELLQWTSWVFWTIEVVAGVAIVVVALVRTRPHRSAIAR